MGKEPEETFTDRFKRLTAGLSDGRLSTIMGLSPYAVRKLRQGDTQSLKIESALRLCRELNISPWLLVGDDSRQEPPPPDIVDRVRLLHGDIVDLQSKLADLEDRVAPLLEREASKQQHRRGTQRRR